MRLSLFFVLTVLVGAGFSDVIFEENFDCRQISQTAVKSGENAVSVSKGSLDFSWLEETGNKLLHKGNDVDAVWDVDIEPYRKNSKTIYISFLLRNLNPDVKHSFAGLGIYNNGNELFGIGNDFESNYFKYYYSGGSRIIGKAPTLVDGEVHLIAARIDFRKGKKDKFTIWLDPLVRRDLNDQNEWKIARGEFEFDFNELRFRAGDENNKWEFDELKIATDWDSLFEYDNSPGGKVSKAIKNAELPGRSEKLDKDVNRFYAKYADLEQVPFSFAIAKEFENVSRLQETPGLRPVFSKTNGRKYVYFDTPAEDDFYGIGEAQGGLKRNGYRIVFYNRDNYNYRIPDKMYQSHPWVMGVRPDGTAYGIIFDTTWKSEIDLRAGILFSVPGDALDFPVYTLEAKNPSRLLEMLGEITGKIDMPPRWAIGYQQCRYSYYPDSRVREIAREFRQRQIPCDVIWLDIHYMDGYRIFTFDPERFPNPKGLNDYLHTKGFKNVWMIDPAPKYEEGYSVYDSGSEIDAWVKTKDGEDYIGKVWPGKTVFPDYTIPRVRKWWADHYQDFLDQGVDGVWNDMNEPAVFEAKGHTMPPDNIHRGGGKLKPGKHIQYHNVYGYLMIKATREGMLQYAPNKRPFVLSRANFLGGQRFGATWTGDNGSTWAHLEQSIPMSLNLSLSGQPFNGPDIGGFVGDATPQLYAHWISAGAYFPFSRSHTANGTKNHEPWSFGEETEKASRRALNKRYRLMPYLYTLFWHSHKNGSAVMKPVFFADPDDKSLRAEDQVFMLGDNLIVIPKWAEDVNLPEGVFRDLEIGDNEKWDKYQCKLLQKGGSIIPVGEKVQSTEELGAVNPITLSIVLDENGKASGRLYEDSGKGYEFKEGEFVVSNFKAERTDGGISVTCDKQVGEFAYDKRFVKIAWITENGISFGYGDICKEIEVMKTDKFEYIE
ncbi:Alpha-xylosidase [Sedimentisphaera cyanobacteriorum]|uniref:Alpha-xylosidase n=1 Tax=Sedimentisphaera cyanobacteriorum TaxID=1940790 RepID=A0A1Q2HNM6_9BACT|nr:TIM-barrel domain-containing protein [Sedimentisphaera cyanobacteriorum]AQQ08836.1 Alpha-xylosidase [Sedimentisphaera cyanobacteriorum]